MRAIDNEMLDALFLLSRFELDESRREQQLADLNHWLAFFSLENVKEPETMRLEFAINAIEELRSDTIEPSLSIQKIKTFCPRFLDGFVALPARKGASLNGN